jgi:predicted SAM-dependent methyltransferase
MQAVKLNIGAGKTKIPGFTPIDRMFGDEAYPLKYETNSVSEIRASHVLEHFSFKDAFTALEDWVRVLEPGGRLRIAVPDVDKCLAGGDKNRLFYLMGGQTDDNDFHKSAYDRHRLRQTLEQAGLEHVEEWESDGLDTSGHPVSLNLQGIKPAAKAADIPAIGTPHPDRETAKLSDVKIAAYMTLPRYEAVASRSIAETALRKLGIGLATSQGVFWGQCMQRMFNDAIDQGVDWILSLDSDSLFNEQHVSDLFDVFGQHPEADAMAALQCRRGKKFPLLTIGGKQEAQLGSLDPLLVTTAHFGLTLIRVDALKDVPKPWFYSQPDEDGEYGDNRLDDDIWFWHQWRLAGKKIYVAPSVSIGHLEETVAVFDEELQPKHEYIAEWRSKHLNQRQSDS